MKKQTDKKTAASRNGNGKRKSPPPSKSGKTGNSGKTHTGEDMDSALHEYFMHNLKDIYWAEKHLLKVLPKMAKATSTGELQEAFETHLDQTKEHVGRIEKVFELLGEKPVAKKCEGMEGLTKEGETAIEETEAGSMTRDAALIVSAQKVEHYEITSYGSLAQLARTMGHDEVAELLGQILDEEKDTDEILTGLAESTINMQAAQESY